MREKRMAYCIKRIMSGRPLQLAKVVELAQDASGTSVKTVVENWDQDASVKELLAGTLSD